ncbi:TrkH family potassium uptake protein [Devosia salina]|uniref:TrkH family potassium uptake protein n=1 Tax=Devosia salina TaxID=2860336 RepID=A0ABX8WIL5_9HYPH|nr:potassium transporter TrkG [Devosia salina]QYO78628.1 TrkH family potassium uptake protein [Devosia salina]
MRSSLQHPARLVPLAFLAAIAIGTALLLLPIARVGLGGADIITALFTATSAVCVTGLIVVDTPTYWTPFGQAVILALIQVGGFGIMTGSTLLGVLISRRLGLRTRIIAQAETRTLDLGDVTGVLRLIFVVTLLVELFIWALLALRLHWAYGEPLPVAIWNGLFHAISAYNNAGFSTYSDSLMGFANDWLFLGPIMLAVIVGGIGFPVLADLKRRLWQPSKWSVHTKITLLGTVVLIVVGTLTVLAYESAAEGTLTLVSLPERLLDALFHSVMTRTAGFNSVDIGALRTETLVVTDMLMFIGGGSAGTAGGIKVSTVFILALAVWAEIRGETDTTAFHRRFSTDVLRQALTLIVLASIAIALATLHLLSVTAFPLEQVLFETISAFATVGLSTGITGSLPPSAELTLIALMFVGRVGTITVATGLALKRSQRPYRYPEERPIVG